MSISKTFVGEVQASGEEIHEIHKAMEPVLINVSTANVVIACLSLVLQIQKPDITPEQLVNGVRETSQFICILLEEAEPGLLREKMN